MGNLTNYGLATANTGTFLLAVAFLGYVMLILYPFLRYRRAEPGDAADFQWHFLVPCLDEALVIAATVERARLDHPEAHLWCVDDHSNDETAAILRALADADPLIHVVERRRPFAQEGKGHALNAAWRALDAWVPAGTDKSRLIVGVIDADGFLDPACTSWVAGDRYFGDERVGAVQIQVRMMEVFHHPSFGEVPRPKSLLGRALVRMQDMEFAAIISAMQTLRGTIGSVGMGGNGQFTRLSVLNDIADTGGSPWNGALLEDLELGLHTLMTGYQTAYCQETWVAQQALSDVKRLVRQRCRWGQGAMQCIRYFKPILRSPKITSGGALEIAHFLILPWLQILGSVFYMICTGVMAYYAFYGSGGPIGWASEWVGPLLPVFLLFGLGPIVVWGFVYRSRIDRSISWPRAALYGFMNWPYSLVNLSASWWAFARILTGRSNWQKTARTALTAETEAPIATTGGVASRKALWSPTGGTVLVRPSTAPPIAPSAVALAASTLDTRSHDDGPPARPHRRSTSAAPVHGAATTIAPHRAPARVEVLDPAGSVRTKPAGLGTTLPGTIRLTPLGDPAPRS